MFSWAKEKVFFLFLLLIFITSIFTTTVSGSTGLEWIKNFGGSGKDILHASIVTSDNHFLLVGESNSFTQDNYDLYIAKVTLSGALVWNTTFGDETVNEDDAAYSVIETSDGYLITGKIVTSDGIGDSVLLLKLDFNGNTLWYKFFGRNTWAWGNDLLQQSDNSIIIVGTTQVSFGFPADVFLIKSDSDGNEIWKRTHRHSGNQVSSSIIASQNNFLVLGTSSDSSNRDSNIFLMKLDSDGRELWYKQYGGLGRETGYQISKVGTNYLIIGSTNSYGNGKYDVYILKIDSNGNVLWEKTVGSPADEYGRSIFQVSDKIVITANTFKETGRSLDQYFITLNQNGDLTFNETYGTNAYERGINTHQIGENTYYLTGYSGSRNSDFSLTKINLDPYTLNIESIVGNPTGGGQYYLGANPVVEINEMVLDGANTRYIFTGWTSSSYGGYTGPEPTIQLTINNDVTQTANWQKQYYIEIQAPNGSVPSVFSGWFNEGEQISIRVSLEEGFTFSKWEGIGLGSYSGSNRRADLLVNGPITQTLILDDVPRYTLELVSEFGESSGSGEYFDGTRVDFNLSQSEVYLDDFTRFIFEKWASSSNNGYNGVDLSSNLKMENDVIETAVWKKQYFVNVTGTLDNANMFEAGWYDSDSELEFYCSPEEGYTFSGWQGEGVGSYSGSDSSFVLILEAPIIERAILSVADSFVLNILSDYGDTPDSAFFFENTNVTLTMVPDLIYLSNTIRVKFNGWICSSQNGYSGKDNPVQFQIQGDTIQEAIWIKQYYVEASDFTINDWYDENSRLILPLNTSGVLIPTSKQYKIDSAIVQDSIIVGEPMFIQVSLSRSYTNLQFLFSIALFSGSTYIYRNHQRTLDSKKGQIMNELMLHDSLSLLEIYADYDLSFSQANAIAVELGNKDGFYYDLPSMTLYTYPGMAKMVIDTLRDFGEIDVSRLAQIIGIKVDELSPILHSNKKILLKNDSVKLI